MYFFLHAELLSVSAKWRNQDQFGNVCKGESQISFCHNNMLYLMTPLSGPESGIFKLDHHHHQICCLTGWNKHLLQLLDEGSACTLLKPHLGILFTCFQMYPSKINHCIKHEADSPDATRKRQIRRFFLLFLRDVFPFEGMNIGKPDHPNTLMLIKNFFFFFISNQIKKKIKLFQFFMSNPQTHTDESFYGKYRQRKSTGTGISERKPHAGQIRWPSEQLWGSIPPRTYKINLKLQLHWSVNKSNQAAFTRINHLCSSILRYQFKYLRITSCSIFKQQQNSTKQGWKSFYLPGNSQVTLEPNNINAQMSSILPIRN